MFQAVRRMLLVDDGHTLTVLEMESLLFSLYAAVSFSRSPAWERVAGQENILTGKSIDAAIKNAATLSLSPAEVRILVFLRENLGDLQVFRRQQGRCISPDMLEAALAKANSIVSAKMRVCVSTDGGREFDVPRHLDSRELCAVIERRCKTKRWFGLPHEWKIIEERKDSKSAS